MSFSLRYTAWALLAAVVMSQTPLSVVNMPTTPEALVVKFAGAYGNISIVNGNPYMYPVFALPPIIYSVATILPCTAIMLDISYPIDAIPGNSTPKANFTPGIVPNTTTRLVWFQGNLTAQHDGPMLPSVDPLVPYDPPGVRDNTLGILCIWLFETASPYAEAITNGTYSALDSPARINFDIGSYGDFGPVLGATWFAAENSSLDPTADAPYGPSKSAASTTGWGWQVLFAAVLGLVLQMM